MKTVMYRYHVKWVHDKSFNKSYKYVFYHEKLFTKTEAGEKAYEKLLDEHYEGFGKIWIMDISAERYTAEPVDFLPEPEPLIVEVEK